MANGIASHNGHIGQNAIAGNKFVTLYSSKAHVFFINPETKNSWLAKGERAIPVSFVASINNHDNNEGKRELKVIGTDEDGEIVLESTILPKTTFNKRSQKFVQWTDPTDTTYGFGFNSETELTEFFETFQQLQRDMLLPQTTSANITPQVNAANNNNSNSLPKQQQQQQYSQSSLMADPHSPMSQNECQIRDRLKYENERLKQALEESSKNAGIWHNELLNLRTNNVKLTLALQESKAHVEEWERELLSLRDENKDLKSRISALESAKEPERDQKLHNFNSKLESKISELADLQKEFAQTYITDYTTN